MRRDDFFNLDLDYLDEVIYPILVSDVTEELWFMYNDKEVDVKSREEVVNIVNFVREGLSISELSGRIRELILEYKEEERQYREK